jgi:hypothetical protein
MLLDVQVEADQREKTRRRSAASHTRIVRHTPAASLSEARTPNPRTPEPPNP